MEPISPELALIDPDLARRARSAVAPHPAPRRPLPSVAAREPWWSPSPLVALVALASLAANGILVARLVIPADRAEVGVVQTVAPTAVAPPPTFRPAPSASAVQRRLVALIERHGRVLLPSTWVDRATGVPETTLQTRCRQEAGIVSCSVRPRGGTTGIVRVRWVAGTGFIWSMTEQPVRAPRPPSRRAPHRG